MLALRLVLLLSLGGLLLLLRLLRGNFRLWWLESGLRLFDLLVESVRPLIFKLLFVNVVFDFHFDALVLGEVAEDLVEQLVRDLVDSHVEITCTAVFYSALEAHASAGEAFKVS